MITPNRLAAVTYTTKDAATMATFDVTPTDWFDSR